MLIQDDKPSLKHHVEHHGEIIEIDKNLNEINDLNDHVDHSQPSPPTTHLMCSFVWWTSLSLIASIFIVTGFWLPYWFEGYHLINSNVDDNVENIQHQQQQQHQLVNIFSPFRRCNRQLNIINDDHHHSIITNNNNGQWLMLHMFKCVRYGHVTQIPTFAWKLTTLLVGMGSLCSMLITFILLLACCCFTRTTLTTSNICLLILAQILIILIIAIGCFVYPYGWYELQQQQQHEDQRSEEIDLCKDFEWQKPFDLETCQPSLSLYLIAIGLCTTFLCLLFAACTSIQYRQIF